eukprot:10940359-Alexandrium_andersonii.AAC.1
MINKFTPGELRGPIPRPLLDPCSSRFERLKRFCVSAWRIAGWGGLQHWRALGGLRVAHVGAL